MRCKQNLKVSKLFILFEQCPYIVFIYFFWLLHTVRMFPKDGKKWSSREVAKWLVTEIQTYKKATKFS